ncbi:MAG: hemerythrin domain-containing protein [Rhizobacter sp.]|nr:hemerythrin domain-containing protein [Chlorobiales bacterium]
MNAIELLTSDHEKVAKIFEKLGSTTERSAKTREELFTKLKQELDTHTHLEETIFYPALKENKLTHDMVLEAYEEHHVAKFLLNELEDMEKNREEWKAKLTVLQEAIEHHVEEEEGDLFVKTRKVLDKATLDSLGEQMQDEKLRYTAALPKQPVLS